MTALLSEFLFSHESLFPYKCSFQVKATQDALVLKGKREAWCALQVNRMMCSGSPDQKSVLRTEMKGLQR